MCTGHYYDLVCGHKLIHYATRCSKVPKDPNASEPCALPTGPRYKLSDTCAPCHPSFQTTSICGKYDADRDFYMRRIRDESSLGNLKMVKDFEQLVKSNQTERTRELAKVADLRKKMADNWGREVIWPGKKDLGRPEKEGRHAEGEWGSDDDTSRDGWEGCKPTDDPLDRPSVS